MRAHLSNAAYGVLDYAAYPIAMILSAPTLLRHLGVEQYGIWIVITAALNTGSIIASGFGDANIQYIAGARNQGDADLLVRAVRSMLGINLLLGGVLALISWMLVPLAVGHLVGSAEGLAAACLLGLRIASVLMLVRAIETVCVSTQRAFERYGAAIRISLFTRVITVAAAVVLSIRGFGVAGIMEATACFLVLGTLAQLIRLQQYLGAASLFPSFDRNATTALFQFGAFSWLLAVASVVFTQADRLLLGVSLGATTVTAYALCVQMAQPIYGFAASGLHFLFPYLAARNAVSRPAAIRKAVLAAFSVNLLVVAIGAGVVTALRPCRPQCLGWSIGRAKCIWNTGSHHLELRVSGAECHRLLRIARAGPCPYGHCAEYHGRPRHAAAHGLPSSLAGRSWNRDGPSILRAYRLTDVRPACPCAGGRTGAIFIRGGHSPSL